MALWPERARRLETRLHSHPSLTCSFTAHLIHFFAQLIVPSLLPPLGHCNRDVCTAHQKSTFSTLPRPLIITKGHVTYSDQKVVSESHMSPFKAKTFKSQYENFTFPICCCGNYEDRVSRCQSPKMTEPPLA